MLTNLDQEPLKLVRVVDCSLLKADEKPVYVLHPYLQALNDPSKWDIARSQVAKSGAQQVPKASIDLTHRYVSTHLSVPIRSSGCF
jgi:hypothetical protein